MVDGGYRYFLTQRCTGSIDDWILNLAIDQAGTVYGTTLTGQPARVVVLDASLNVVRQWGGGDGGAFQGPNAIGVEGARVYVADDRFDPNGKSTVVKVYNTTGSFLYAFSGYGASTGLAVSRAVQMAITAGNAGQGTKMFMTMTTCCIGDMFVVWSKPVNPPLDYTAGVVSWRDNLISSIGGVAASRTNVFVVVGYSSYALVRVFDWFWKSLYTIGTNVLSSHVSGIALDNSASRLFVTDSKAQAVFVFNAATGAHLPDETIQVGGDTVEGVAVFPPYV